MTTNTLHFHHWLRAVVLAAASLGFTTLAPAQTLDFGSCVRIADMSSRLACYDRAAGYSQSGTAPAAPPAAPAAPAVMPQAPAPLPALPTPGARPAPQPGAPLLAPQAPADPVAAFGAKERAAEDDPLTAQKIEKKKAAESQELKQIEARVTAVRKRPAGEQVLTLDNGQVWTQTEARQQPQFEVGDVVIIKRGLLGSFLLTLQKGSASTRVQRIS